MVSRFYGYQYDTSPRKLNPENTPIRNRYSRNTDDETNSYNNRTRTTHNQRKPRDYYEEEETYLFENSRRQKNKKNEINVANNELKQKSNINQNAQISNKSRINVKSKLKIIMFLITGFSILFAISYQNSLINESFNKKEQYKKEAEALSKTNQQMEVNIENSLNLNNIEQVAKEKLGMQKLSNNQKVYVNLPKEDFVAPASEQVVIEEDTGFFGKIVKGFSKSIK